MIVEAIVTTTNDDGSVNVSPMGPSVAADDHAFGTFELRPYPTSTTFKNLKRAGQGVLHITDNVLLFARAAISQLQATPPVSAAKVVDGFVLNDTCRWYEFQVESMDESGPRMSLSCETVHRGRTRDFGGFNRAKHAVLEAAILATRVQLLTIRDILEQFGHLEIIVNKTAGPNEQEAFHILKQYVTQSEYEPSPASG